MESEPLTRKLAAILHADVVGYSRMMGEDESGTLARLKAHRKEFIDPTIASHHGRMVKLMGDGALIEFASVVDALACAVEVQRGMTERNKDEPEDRRIEFRIGINLGDVIVEGDDIYGDGVNVAARLESLAEPGGICISESVYTAVSKKLPVDYEFMGEQQVKNIEQPVRTYHARVRAGAELPKTSAVAGSKRIPRTRLAAIAAVVVIAVVGIGLAWLKPWQPDTEPASVERMAFPLPEKPSIVVLPFDNLSGDPEQEYFVDGLTEDIITDLTRYPDFFVIARHSSFAYKNKAVKAQQVAEELGVQYLVEGSIQRTSKQFRITAQLIDAL
ncbi:MAG: guanylyl cyclase, partial [Gammaproteobacteria bacterium]|nr:guanylyl cyclase [Gammaproteobacteria bacterium]